MSSTAVLIELPGGPDKGMVQIIIFVIFAYKHNLWLLIEIASKDLLDKSNKNYFMLPPRLLPYQRLC